MLDSEFKTSTNLITVEEAFLSSRSVRLAPTSIMIDRFAPVRLILYVDFSYPTETASNQTSDSENILFLFVISFIRFRNRNY